MTLTATTAIAKGLKGKVIYVNPGHGGWTVNDRPHATINYEEMDTMSFFESKTCLWKALELRDRLRNAGAKVVMSRTTNGWVSEGDKNITSNDRYETYDDGTGQQQLITLFKIASQVDSLNPDYFIALHSNATGGGDGKKVNYLLYMYRGETGNDYAKGSIDRARVAFPYAYDNPLTVWTSPDTSRYIAGDLTWMGGTPPGTPNALGYTGWLAVLKHKVPSFLVEGSFHSYQPERQRLMNRDYCRMEGIRSCAKISPTVRGSWARARRIPTLHRHTTSICQRRSARSTKTRRSSSMSTAERGSAETRTGPCRFL